MSFPHSAEWSLLQCIESKNLNRLLIWESDESVKLIKRETVNDGKSDIKKIRRQER